MSRPGGGAYSLSYEYANQQGIPNSFKVIIGSVDGSFSPIVLDPLTDAPRFNWIWREFAFNVPEGTSTITLTFEVRKVRH